MFKVEFKKALGLLNLNFIDDIMTQMGFVNRAPSNEFTMERGIRQGDPLSPFLFIIAAEGLRVAIVEVVEKGYFTDIKPLGIRFILSIFQYADDAILLGEWSINNVKNLIRIFSCFHILSRLKINIKNVRSLELGASKGNQRDGQ